MAVPQGDDRSFKGVFAVLDTIQTDIAALKTDIAAVKTDLAAVKTELAALPKIKKDITDMKQDITAIRTTVEAHSGELRVLEGDFHTFCAQTKQQFIATDTNALARVMNTRATQPVSPLEPLRESATNQVIRSFPKTAGEIDNMNGPAVESVLEALGFTVANTIQENRQRLKRALGITLHV